MTLQQIKYILEVARAGSMNKAAERLYISQPTLTGTVREVEAETGITIFSRTNRGVLLTNDGREFLENARQLYQQYELLLDRYTDDSKRRQKFGVSTQHYSFAVKAFVETVKKYDTLLYDFAIRETRTEEVIRDVADGRSEIGVLFVSDYNKKLLKKRFSENDLIFTPLVQCAASVYLWKGHPLAKREAITFAELREYPCLSFEQGEQGTSYLAEEILSDRIYPRTIRATDRATMLNLMIGLNGYTLCSGIVCEELNGDDCIAVPFSSDEENKNSEMSIGSLMRKGERQGEVALTYLAELTAYLKKAT